MRQLGRKNSIKNRKLSLKNYNDLESPDFDFFRIYHKMSQDISSNNKRIAKNTFFLYIRMFISMAVSLYTSRVILQVLGVEDYGLYNIVGGVVAMFSFINSTMSSATSRFLTYELGKGNQEKLNDTFNASFWVHVIIAVFVFLLCETVGLWFIINKMVVPEGRELAAHIVFQLSIVSTIISITQVPYNATLIAHEKMDIYAYVEMANVLLKLLILYLLVVLNYDKLILYGILVLTVNTCIMMFYRAYGARKYEECHIKLKYQSDIIKPMLAFSGWDFYGNMSVTARTSGVSMLLNVFFGPVANAAAGIAASVQTAVLSFANNINTAVKPQIVKYYAVGDYQRMSSLINNACKLNFLIMAMLIVPLCIEIDYVLNLWLSEVPKNANIFCVLTLMFILFSNISLLVCKGIEAYGRIIRPSLINGTLYLLVIPFSYIVFRNGGSAWFAFAFNIVAVIIGMCSNVYTLHKYVPDYSISEFFTSVLFRCMLLLIIACGAYVFSMIMLPSFCRLILTTLMTTLLLTLSGWFILLSSGTKELIRGYVLKIVCRRK